VFSGKRWNGQIYPILRTRFWRAIEIVGHTSRL
jgi:hypothetical protein